MNNHFKTFAAIPLATAMLAGTAFGLQTQTTRDQQRQQQQQDQRQYQQDQRQQDRQTGERGERDDGKHTMSDKIVGKDVVDRRGESLGSIEDLIIDLNDGKAPYAVVSFSDNMRSNYNRNRNRNNRNNSDNNYDRNSDSNNDNNKIAVPMHAFSWDQEEERFVLSTSQTQLQNAPEFDGDDLDKLSDESWVERTRRVFGSDRDQDRQQRDGQQRDGQQGQQRDGQQGQQGQQQRDQQRRDQQQQQRDRQQRDGQQGQHRDQQQRDRSAGYGENDHKQFAMLSDIDDIEIICSDGDELGSISKLVIDRSSGNVSFATVNDGGSDANLIPWEAMERTEEKKFRVSIAKNRIENAPKLAREDQLRNDTFVQSIYRHYQVSPDQRRGASDRQDQQRRIEQLRRQQQGG